MATRRWEAPAHAGGGVLDAIVFAIQHHPMLAADDRLRNVPHHLFAALRRMRLRPQRPAVRATAFLLALTACASDDRVARGADPSVQIADSAGVRTVTITSAPTDLPEWRLADEPLYTITGATTGDSTSLSLVGPVRWLTNGGVVALDLDASRLVVFDSTGRFLRALGRRGAGPGEMQWLASMAVQRGDTITTYDGSLRRLSFWHAEHGYARQVSLNESDANDISPLDAWAWQDSLVVVLLLRLPPPPPLLPGRTVAKWSTMMSLALRNDSGRTLATSPEFEGSYSALDAQGDSRLPFANVPFVALGADAAYFGSGADFRLRRLAPTFALDADIRWPRQQEPLTESEVDGVREESIRLLAQRIPLERAQRAFDGSFLPELLPVNRPAIGRVFVDDRTRLWVERFEAIRLGSQLQTPATRWTILDADGTPRAALVLDPYTRLEDVRDDRAIVVRRDSLDVEYLAAYRLRD
jgi:hypothetical protein